MTSQIDIPSRPYLADLDAIRGIASLLVLFFHLEANVAAPSRVGVGTWANPISAFIYSGHTGVTLFFILSAFLLSLPLLNATIAVPRTDAKTFFRRRALRILPLYWTAVFVAVVASLNHLEDLARALPFLTFMNGAGFGGNLMPWSATWWSLATEAQFYLLLPLLPLAVRTRASRVVAASILIILTVLYWVFVTGIARPDSGVLTSRIAHSVFGRAPAFLLGVTVAWIYQRYGDFIRSSLENKSWLRAGGADLMLLAVLLLLGMLLRWVAHVGYAVAEFGFGNHVWHALEAFLWSSVLFLVLFAPMKAKRLLGSRPLVWVGVVSYSTYIWHYPAIIGLVGLASRHIGPVPWNYDAVGLTLRVAIAVFILAVSGLSYRVIEAPFLRRKVGRGR